LLGLHHVPVNILLPGFEHVLDLLQSAK
jgi:hypothetical protein